MVDLSDYKGRAQPNVSQGAARSHINKADGRPPLWFYNHSELLKPFATATFAGNMPEKQMPVLQVNGRHHVIVLHLFAGRRRPLDIHYWLHQLLQKEAPHIQLCLLSADTAIHEDFNLAQGRYLEGLKRLCEKGWVGAALTGPPCETFSAARHQPPPSDAKRPWKWPRPLRSKENLWGIAGLRPRELRQLAMGSQLLLTSALLETKVARHGGATLMEHPDEWHPASPPNAPSWSAPALQRYHPQMRGYDPISIEQWQWGAKGVKPTRLRAMGFTKMRQALESCKTGDAKRPRQGLVGLATTGTWRTSAAKEYPPDLCKGIASGVVAQIMERLSNREALPVTVEPNDELFRWAMTQAKKAEESATRSSWLPDFQG